MLLQLSRFPPFLLAFLLAEPVSPSQAQHLHKIGVVSADGATTLDGLEANWPKKPQPLAQAPITLPPPLVMTK
ncbi:putative exported protein [Salmonella bongori]|nr:putative exported protein [Salmonella bongori]